MVKFSLGFGFIIALLLSQVPTNSVPEPHDPIGPFENAGQVLIIVFTMVTQFGSTLFLGWQQGNREKAKDALALKQRELDIQERKMLREFDLADRAEARLELERKQKEAARDVKDDLESAKRLLVVKVEETRKHTELQGEKLDQITTLVDGAKSELLREIATLKQDKANVSGSAADQVAADAAEQLSRNQDQRIVDAGGSRAVDKKLSQDPEERRRG